MQTSLRPILITLVLLSASCGSSGPCTCPELAEAPIADAALSFDGVDDLAQMSAPPGHFSFAGGLTLEAWIRPNTIPQLSETSQRFIGQDGSVVFALVTGASGVLRGSIWTGGSTALLSPPATIQAGVWQHIALTYDLTTVRMYVDAFEVASMPLSAGPADPMTDLYLGNMPTMIHDGAYEGEIDDVRVWGLARTPFDIAAGIFGTVGPTSPGLLAHYRFEGSGQTVTDSSQHGIDGALGSNGFIVDPRDPERVSSE